MPRCVRIAILTTLLAAFGACASGCADDRRPAHAPAQEADGNRATTSVTSRLGSRDFDFAFGTWYITNKRLSEPLSGAGEWTQSITVLHTEPWLNGLGNIDEVVTENGPLGGSVRLYDSAQRRWADYWISTRDGVLQPPAYGSFQGGGGVFLGADNLNGQPIKVRYTWSGTNTENPRWVQDFSNDDGKSWETNWIMDFGREQLALPPTSTTSRKLGSRDFDFILGNWQVASRRLKAPLSGSTEWQTGRAEQRAKSMLGGLGNRDEFFAEDRLIGGSLRLYDVKRQRWAIYWVSTRDGILQPPVYGSFQNGFGVFEGDDTYEGKPIRTRFTWSAVDTPTPRWEQAFSTDQGKTWEVNWIMEFSKHEPPQDSTPHGR